MNTLRLVILAALPAATALGAAAPAAEKAEVAAAPAPRRTLVQLAADKRALAGRLVEALKLREQMEANLVEIRRNLDESFDRVLSGEPAASHKDLVEQYRTRVRKIADDAFARDAVSDEVIQIYAAAHTERELKDILAFLETPSGKTFAAKSAGIGGAISRITHSRMEAMQPKIQGAIYEMSLEIQRLSGGAAPAPAGR